MKKNLLLILVLMLTVSALAQISFVDVTTRSTNTTSSGSAFTLITITGICTNLPYSTTNSQYLLIGDPLPTAFGKVNTDFAYLASAVRTNGGFPNYVFVIDTNSPAGGHWTNIVTGGGLASINVTNNGVIFQFNTLGQFIISNQITHAYYIFGTNGHPTVYDEYGNSIKFTTNAWSINFTNGNYLNFTNGLFTINPILSVLGMSYFNSSNLIISTKFLSDPIEYPYGIAFQTNNFFGLGPNVLTGIVFKTGTNNFLNATKLGYFNYNWGENTNMQLTLYDGLLPSNNILATTTINFNPGNIGQYVYGSISPVQLKKNNLYSVAMFDKGIHSYVVTADIGAGITTNYDTNFVLSAGGAINGDHSGTNNYLLGSRGYGPANILFQLAGTNFINLITSVPGIEFDSSNNFGFNALPDPNFTMTVRSNINVTDNYYINGIPIGQIPSVPTGPITTPTNGPVFDPDTLAYFTTCDTVTTTNYNGYTVTKFYSYLDNYFAYNPLPAGSRFIRTTIYAQIYSVVPGLGPVLPGSTYYLYYLYTPNPFTTTTNAPAESIQTLTALNNLVLNLKSTGLWQKATNLYPFAALNPVCSANNLKGGTNFVLIFHDYLTNALAFGSFGISNGTGGWADTQFNPSTRAMSRTNLTLATFVISTGATTNYQMSAWDGTNSDDLITTIGATSGTNMLSTISTTNDGVVPFVNNINGSFYAVSRLDANFEYGLIDTTNFFTRTVQTNAAPNANIVLMAKGSNTNRTSNLVLGFAGTFVGLATNDLATLRGIVTQFQVDMGRIPGTQLSTNQLPTLTVNLLSASASPYDSGFLTNIFSRPFTVTSTASTAGITNLLGRAHWNLVLQFTDSATGVPAFTYQLQGIRSNTIAPVAILATGTSVTTNFYAFEVNPMSTNYIIDASTGIGASVTVLDSYLTQPPN